MVKLLCGVRADPTPTYGGQNALGWANERGDDASAQLLTELHMVAEEEQRASFLALRALQVVALVVVEVATAAVAVAAAAVAVVAAAVAAAVAVASSSSSSSKQQQ